jgi:hypothetical protein
MRLLRFTLITTTPNDLIKDCNKIYRVDLHPNAPAEFTKFPYWVVYAIITKGEQHEGYNLSALRACTPHTGHLLLVVLKFLI